jgi:integrase
MTRRRRFGHIRQLPSRRWQATYLTPQGRRQSATSTFATKADADRWLAQTEADILGHRWNDPRLARQLFEQYADQWIEERPNLRPRTVDLYKWLSSKYLVPYFGATPITDVTPASVRAWRRALHQGGVSPSVCAKAYRLLRAVLNTAVDDGDLLRNPCRIRGAGDEHPAERPTLAIDQVLALAGQMPNRYSALVLVAAFASLRFGEATALRRGDVDLSTGIIVIRSSYSERSNGSIELGPPKSRAGRRAIVLPKTITDALTGHLAAFVGPEPDALVFCGPTGRPLRRSNFNRTAGWADAVESVGVPGLHFHDLRHTGNTLASTTPGTSTRDLMERMGHDSMRAALIYQHSTRGGDQRIADALDAQLDVDVARGSHASPLGIERHNRRNSAGPIFWTLTSGAGDENRTRTVSLGS